MYYHDDASDAADAGEQLQNATSKSLNNFNGKQPAAGDEMRGCRASPLLPSPPGVVAVVVKLVIAYRVYTRSHHFAQ